MNKTTPLSVLFCVSLLCAADAGAQSSGIRGLPSAATPGAALPRLAQGNEPTLRQEVQISVPPAMDRSPDPEAGPRILVETFELRIDGPLETAWHGGEFVPRLKALIEHKRRLQPLEGYTIGQLEEITREATQYLRDQGMLVGQVFLPVQTVENGRVIVQVVQGRLDSVSSEGNKIYSERTLARPFARLQGRPVDRDAIDRVLRSINDYPGLTATGLFAPGDEVGTTALSLQVRSEKRFDTSFSVDNYGTEFTGEYRASMLARVNNVTGHGDALDFNLLGTGDPTNAVYGGANYTVPIGGPGRNLSLGYQRNDFDVGRELAEQNINGVTDIVNLGYEHVLARRRDFNASLVTGLARKDAELERLGAPFAMDELAVFSIGFNYDFVGRRVEALNQGSIFYMRGLDDFLGSMNKNGNGQSSRTVPPNLFAGGRFDKWFFTFTRLQRLGENSRLLLRVEGQQSDDLLVSLEQFSLGGPNNVRAYTPSEFLVDTGGFVSLELIVGAPGFADKPFGTRRWGDALEVSLYYDYAGGYLSDPAITLGEEKTQDLHGGGIGIHLRPIDKLSMRLDAAWTGSDLDPLNRREPQFYFRLNHTF